MVRKKSLNSLSNLLDSGFGRPPPRHGLNLLYWFVTQCLQFGYNNQITVLCSPSRGDYGFELFHNKESLLPDTNMPYYEVGNLHHVKARDLPVYVSREDTGNLDNSNTDRIIICVNGIRLERVYVTRHKDLRTFNPNQTYCISTQLLRTISAMEREDFLRQATSPHITIPEMPRETPMRVNQPHRNTAEECCSCRCKCIAAIIFGVFVACVIIYLLVNYLK